jgi:hypothetical protein
VTNITPQMFDYQPANLLNTTTNYRQENIMATWTHSNGDIIVTESTTYTVTRNGVTLTTNVERWTTSAEQWIANDIKAGYYTGFVLKTGENK